MITYVIIMLIFNVIHLPSAIGVWTQLQWNRGGRVLKWYGQLVESAWGCWGEVVQYN